MPRCRTGLLAGLAMLAPLAAFGAPTVAAAHRGLQPYEILVHGTVRQVDARNNTILLAYAPLETAPGGERTCLILDGRNLRLRSGEEIEAVADTRHWRWALRGIHEMLPSLADR